MRVGVLKRSLLIVGALSTALVGTARADDLSVTTSIATPQKTSAAKNGTPGNIDVQSGGAISISTAGAAVTVDSNNALTNEGTISNSANSDAIGVHLLGGFTASLTTTGAIVASPLQTGTGNVGILLDGAGSFTGAITLSSGTTINVSGVNSIGVAINAPVIGDVTQGASITNFGAGAAGVIITAPITGMFTNAGSVVTSGTTTYDNTKIDPEAGYGMALGASVSGGFLNFGPVDSSDTSGSAAITTIGSKPALYISPSIAGAPAANLELGIFNDATNAGYSFINRGSVAGGGNDPGVNATGMRIEGTASLKTIFDGGIYNRGTIRGDATSSNVTATSVAAAAADGTGLAIGANGIVPFLQNDGTITGTTQGPKGGKAVGLLIEAGGSLPQLENTSFITAIGNTTDSTITNLSVYGIQDLSGTLTNIINLGSISATGTALDAGSTLVAADLSHASSAVSFFNSGTVTGVIDFGSGANTFTIDGATALASGRFHAASGGTLEIDINNGKFQSDDTKATTVSVGSGGTTEFALNQTSSAAALISATGDVNFASGAKVTLTPTTFLPATGTYTLVSAGGTLSFDDFSGATQLPLPFLFTGGFVHDAHNLTLNLTRKSAAVLGLSGNVATIYEPAAAAAAFDDDLGQHLLALDSASAVQQTLDTMLPNIGIGSRALTVAVTDQATGPIGARQRGLVTAPKQGLGFWSQQFYDDVQAGTSSTSRSYFGSGYGIAMGAEWGATRTARYGVGYSFFAGQVTEKYPRTSKEDMSLNMLSFYSGWRAQNFFFTPQLDAGIANFTGDRMVTAGGFSRIADGDWSAYVASGGFSTGYVLSFGPLQIIPQISLDGLYLHQTAYSETGGGQGIDMNVGKQDVRSLRLFAGVVAQGVFPVEEGRLQPQILAGWSHEFENNTPVIDVSFQALPGSPFALVGPTADPSKLIGGASFSYIFNNWSAGLNYDASRASGSLAQSATMNLTSKF